MNIQPKTRTMAVIPVFAALIGVCTWISIPGVVPFTMQTFAVFLTLWLLGGRRGTLAILVYILLGLAGVPIFSGFSAGPAVLFGATGGYIVGFIAIGLIYMLATQRWGTSGKIKVSALLVGLMVCYAFGTLWFTVVYGNKVEPIGFQAALGMCVLPFVLPDLGKMALAIWIAGKIQKYTGDI